MVVDVAAKASGERIFLLAQSFMPTQEIHVLKNPRSEISPWYPAKVNGPLATPEWDFHKRTETVPGRKMIFFCRKAGHAERRRVQIYPLPREDIRRK